MRGIDQFVPRTFGANDMDMAGSFQTVGTTAGALARSYINAPRGLGKMTVTYSATGVYLVALPPGMNYPRHAWSVQVDNSVSTAGSGFAANFFDAKQSDQDTLNSATPTFTVQCCNASGTPVAPADLAGNRISFRLIAGNTTGA